MYNYNCEKKVLLSMVAKGFCSCLKLKMTINYLNVNVQNKNQLCILLKKNITQLKTIHYFAFAFTNGYPLLCLGFGEYLFVLIWRP